MPALSNDQQIGILVGIFKLKGYQSPFQLQPLYSHEVLVAGTLERCLHQYLKNFEQRKGPIPEFRLSSNARLGKQQQVYRLEFQLSHDREMGFQVRKLTLHSMHGTSEQRHVESNWALPSAIQLLPERAQSQRQRMLPPLNKRRRKM